MDPVAIHLMPVAFNRSAMRAATLGSAMHYELAQSVRDLIFGPVRVLRAKRCSFELSHFLHELQCDLQPLRRCHFAKRLDLLRVQIFAHLFLPTAEVSIRATGAIRLLKVTAT